jgi:hypothetical protein
VKPQSANANLLHLSIYTTLTIPSSSEISQNIKNKSGFFLHPANTRMSSCFEIGFVSHNHALPTGLRLAFGA